MTRYERQEGFKEGDKVWALGLDSYSPGLLSDNSPSFRNGSLCATFFPVKYGLKREGIILRRNNYTTKHFKGGNEQRCYTVSITCFGVVRNVSESLLRIRKD